VDLHGGKQIDGDLDLVNFMEVGQREVRLRERKHWGQVDVLGHDGFNLLGNHSPHRIVSDFPELDPSPGIPIRLDLDQLQFLQQLILIDTKYVPLDADVRGRQNLNELRRHVGEHPVATDSEHDATGCCRVAGHDSQLSVAINHQAHVQTRLDGHILTQR